MDNGSLLFCLIFTPAYFKIVLLWNVKTKSHPNLFSKYYYEPFRVGCWIINNDKQNVSLTCYKKNVHFIHWIVCELKPCASFLLTLVVLLCLNKSQQTLTELSTHLLQRRIHLNNSAHRWLHIKMDDMTGRTHSLKNRISTCCGRCATTNKLTYGKQINKKDSFHWKCIFVFTFYLLALILLQLCIYNRSGGAYNKRVIMRFI